ncbi:hypothetical protein R6U77_16515 [Lysinibacillus louembei]|uniref:Aminodeoxychorismate lyase n=1 Tax=Lysinibacillus louembei TaxID=1470088 RepID=A0ABZ0RW11_9BACI|nr:hypothetical protein [Lysinibacillus louembei]WPK11476.1 hypothetical protein R6U77_16515 [Lysinibacillus louembei]
MKSFLRTFGIALFLVGALLTIGKQLHIPMFSYGEANGDTKKQEARIQELEQQLVKANAQVVELQQANEQQEISKEEPAENTEQPSKVESDVVSGVVDIYEGISIYDIGKKVEDLGILANGRELELFLSKPEYSRSIQKGQFELHSAMTLEQMARTLTGKKVE